MYRFVVLSSLMAVVWTDSYVYPVPSRQLQTPIVIAKTSTQGQQQQQQPHLQQYFTQDSFDQYAYGYSEPLSRKQEIRTLNGITRGSYSYIDAHGLLQTVDYTADAGGFHVAATNLPIANQNSVTETPEVALAREQHLAAHQAILNGDISKSSILPQPVKDTAEVAAAKKDFFARFALEEEKQKMLRKATTMKTKSLMPIHTPLPAVRSPPISAKTAKESSSPGNTLAYVHLPQHLYLPVF